MRNDGRLLAVIPLLLLSLLGVVGGAKSVTEIVDGFFPPKETNPGSYYDKRLRPNYGDKPLKVTVSAFVLDIFNVDEKNHEFTAQLYLRQRWVDPRLSFQPPAGIKDITLDPETAKKVWAPDTFVVNERSSSKHDVTVENTYVRIQPDGEVLQSLRLTITASCRMNLKWFPFDRHICSLDFESYGYRAEEFFYEWAIENGQPRIGVSSGAGGQINMEVRAFKGATTTINVGSGSYSRFSIQALIVRVPTRFLQDVYFPAFILVLIAFITMTVGALQFRVLLSLICMATIITFTALLAQEMPKVSYQTALDFYVFKCSFMVFNVVIVNFIMYHLLKSRVASPGRMRMRTFNGNPEDGKEILPDSEGSEEFNVGRPSFDSKLKELIYKCCMYSQYTMPCFFLLFNLIYWIVVLAASSSVGGDADFMLLENTD